jgi:hypothetical protein
MGKTMETNKKPPKQPLSTQDVYLSEMLGDIYDIKKETAAMLVETKAAVAEVHKTFEDLKQFMASQNKELEKAIRFSSSRINEETGNHIHIILESLDKKGQSVLGSLATTQEGYQTQLFKLAETAFAKNAELGKQEIDKKSKSVQNDLGTTMNNLIARIQKESSFVQTMTWVIVFGIVFAVASAYISSKITTDAMAVLWQPTHTNSNKTR